MKYEKTQTAEGLGVGTIVHDILEDGLRFIIMRGPFHFCAYIGVPKDHPLAGFEYDAISFVSAHGGFTFAGEGTKENKWPEGYYWYGWDYGHYGDRSYYASEITSTISERNDKDWTIEEVIKDSWGALYDFKKLRSLAEKIKAKV